MILHCLIMCVSDNCTYADDTILAFYEDELFATVLCDRLNEKYKHRRAIDFRVNTMESRAHKDDSSVKKEIYSLQQEWNLDQY